MLEPIEMTRLEAEALLRIGVVGRVALCGGDGPHIVPVNYSVVDDQILLRTTPYSLLGRLARDIEVAFEVDHLDLEQHHGWSVVVRGRAGIVEDPDELEHIEAVWPPRPWVVGNRPLMVRISWGEVTGRRLGRGWDPLAEASHRRTVTT